MRTSGSHTVRSMPVLIGRCASAALLRRHAFERPRMEVRLHPFALLVERVHLVTAPIDLDATDGPAVLRQELLQLRLGLPSVLGTRVTSGKTRSRYGCGNEGRDERESSDCGSSVHKVRP